VDHYLVSPLRFAVRLSEICYKINQSEKGPGSGNRTYGTTVGGKFFS
jgi:hypothetical protein